jgi:hypothetical protein
MTSLVSGFWIRSTTCWAPGGPSRSSRLVADQERDVVGREELLVVLEGHVLARVEVGVGREQEADVGLLLVEHLVGRLARHEVLEPGPVGLLHADVAVEALPTLGVPGDRQVLRLGRELRGVAHAEALRGLLRRSEPVGVLERRARQSLDLVPAKLLLALGERGLRILRNVLGIDLVEVREDRARVLGVGVDVAVLERLEGDHLGPEVELLLDVVARRLERLRVDLAQDELLGEVLRADGDLLAGVRGVALDGLLGLCAASFGLATATASSTTPPPPPQADTARERMAAMRAARMILLVRLMSLRCSLVGRGTGSGAGGLGAKAPRP